MTKRLQDLLETAKDVVLTPQKKEPQRGASPMATWQSKIPRYARDDQAARLTSLAIHKPLRAGLY